ncbi:MAG: hypothetical protein FJ290_00305 [Planctomycetes bacterium]|nr:hypothetical protein [Planctomycetota bacterium]
MGSLRLHHASHRTGARRGCARRRSLLRLGAFALILATVLLPAALFYGGVKDTRLPWSTFFNNPYVTYYTIDGRKVMDYESSADPTHGPAAVEPDCIDIASASPNPMAPGPAPSVWYGYYNGGTAWNPNDPATMNDDYVFFRLRVQGNPKDQGGNGDYWVSRHWNTGISLLTAMATGTRSTGSTWTART